MGYADRDYHQQGMQRPPSRLAGAPVVKWLLIANIAIFVVDLMLRPEGSGQGRRYVPSALGEWGEFSISTGFQQFQLWRLLSFQFLHAGLLHLLFNMYAIYMFGAFAEHYWRSRPFLIYYLLCGVGGALFYVLLIAVPGLLPSTFLGTRLLGASAGVFGILTAVAIIAPEGRIMLLFPPIPMKMRTFALIFIVIEVLMVLGNAENAGGSAGHLGGALAGLLMMKVPFLRNFLINLGDRQVKIVKKPAAPRHRYKSKLKPVSPLTKAEAPEIDRILDKINEEGLQSLTDEERKLLSKAAEE